MSNFFLKYIHMVFVIHDVDAHAIYVLINIKETL